LRVKCVMVFFFLKVLKPVVTLWRRNSVHI
jgi:hypothetical protein